MTAWYAAGTYWHSGGFIRPILMLISAGLAR
jgi:hypothetical protein